MGRHVEPQLYLHKPNTHPSTHSVGIRSIQLVVSLVGLENGWDPRAINRISNSYLGREGGERWGLRAREEIGEELGKKSNLAKLLKLLKGCVGRINGDLLKSLEREMREMNGEVTDDDAIFRNAV